MKVTLSKSVFAVTAIVFGLVACADDATPAGEGDADASAPPSSTVPPASSSPTPAPTSEAKCPSSCKADSECESACPALAGGVQCCDVKSGTCFGSKTATCPAQPDASTDPPPAY